MTEASPGALQSGISRLPKAFVVKVFEGGASTRATRAPKEQKT